MIAGLAERRHHAQPAGFTIHGHVHEAIERNRDAIGGDAIRRKRGRQIAEAPRVNRLIGIEMAEGIGRAGCEQEIVAAYAILDDVQQDVRSVGIELVAGRQPDRFGIIERAARGDDLVHVIGIEGKQIGDLSALWVDHRQRLAL